MIDNSKELFHALFQSSSEAILIVDKSGTVLAHNKQGSRLFGYDDNELVNQNISVLIPNQFRKNHSKHVKDYQHKPESRSMAEGMKLFALHKSGREFPIKASLSPALYEGKPITVTMVMDISEQENAKKKLQELNAELELKVKERTKELINLVNELEGKNQKLKDAEIEIRKALEKEQILNELKTRFVSTASHEFRTPLSTILSSCNLIERYELPEHNDKRKKHIARIKKSVTYLTNLLNDFLSLDKIEAGKMNLQLQKMNIDQLIRDIIIDLNEQKKPGQKIKFECNGDPEIESDPKILKNIVINLLSNAIKYSKENQEIVVAVKIDATVYNIKVKDHGIGIPEDEQSHLFDRFFRAKNTLNIEGTGLGLHIVKKYIDLLNGDITCKSAYMEGTEFNISIPK